MHLLPSLVPELVDVNIQITGVRDDSRRVKQGDLFMAVSGEHYSAQQMLEDIQESGAAAALYDAREQLDIESLQKVPLFGVEDLNEKRGHIASRFYGEPSKSIYAVGVTGTNGKTSCSQYIAAALAEKCGVVGTMGWGFPPELQEPGLTTPDAIRLQEIFSRLVAEEATAVCVEASSHGLVQQRLAGTAFDAAIFTNLTRDHLDYHGSLEAYQDAKQSLFTDFPIKLAILNRDDEFSDTIAQGLAEDVALVTYSLRNPSADVYCEALRFSGQGIEAEVVSPWGQIPLRSSLIGDFNASNLLAVIALLGARGYAPADIAKRAAALVNVKGRMDRIDLANGAVAVIDYAHTPDALENALRALRSHCDGKLVCVMGCGGDRDAGKRPMMGEIASRLADFCIVTDDNPRSEDSGVIIEQILAGVGPNAEVRAISDRAAAIRYSLSCAEAGDIVLIAGKGHEPYQEVNGVREPFSDHDEVHKFLPATGDKALSYIVGFGLTGQSVARYLQQQRQGFVVVEDNQQAIGKFEKRFGPIDAVTLSATDVEKGSTIILSPGVPRTHEFVRKALRQDATLSNDIQMFAVLNKKPLAMITGSNGKSTVTSFVGQIFSKTSKSCLIGGNIGTPALDLLDLESDVVALEVSSYQLEVATNCQPRVAALLNLSPDHLDRYDSVEDYYQAKTNIFRGAEVAIHARDIDFDLQISDRTKVITFGLDEPDEGHYGVSKSGGELHLCLGSTPLIALSQLPQKGRQNVLNSLAAIAVAIELGAPKDEAVAALRHLKNLEHRFEVLAETTPHVVINDSKSTNPASSEAALLSLADETRPIDLILGGLAKGADFSELSKLIGERVARCFVYGTDREQIQVQLNLEVQIKQDLDACLDALNLTAEQPRVVLFSPGCASLDQFANFAERGRYFKQKVRRYIK